MTIKVLQLNIEKGRFIDRIIQFINDRDFDIINFQEVSGGILTYNHIDCMQLLKKSLDQYWVRFVACYGHLDDPSSYQGNAIFIKKSHEFIKEKVLWYKSFARLSKDEAEDFPSLPRNALAVLMKINNVPVWSINTHLPWTKKAYIESEARVELSGKINDFIKESGEPFVLSGDFNASPELKSVTIFSSAGRNLTVENDISNTLNPHTHRAAASLFPGGAAVDYIIAAKSLEILSFRVLTEPDLSDHLALYAEIGI